MTGLNRWWDGGERLEIGGHQLFVWSGGAPGGPVVTLLHGYPGSSHDFAAVADALVDDGHRVIAPDLLGFGASDKPVRHEYSLAEQTDLVEGVWQRLGVSATTLVAHDYSVTIAEELLDRGASLTRVFLLNGGVFPALHRPTPVQEILLDPVRGPELAMQLNEEAVKAGLGQTFARPDEHVLDDLWRALSRDDGHRLAHTLLHYVGERAEHGDRWVAALEATEVPLTFIWGPEDAVSGGHVIPEIRRRLPGARVVELEGVSHWPQLEAPEAVIAAIREDLA